MKLLRVNLHKEVDDSYDVLIGSGLLGRIVEDLKQNPIGNRYAIITDSNVEKRHGKQLLGLLRKGGLKADLISFRAGETSKNLKTFAELSEKLFSLGLDRKSAIISLGGGVVGDVVGYLAGTYMRGVPYIQVPTTLLAQVDSSIGGKVAVDLKAGKNCSGLFYQPKRVYIDVALLKGLPEREIKTGLVEIIKHAVIADKPLFNLIEQNLGRIIKLDAEILTELIFKSCEIKAKIVSKDEKENGPRMVVNYGHSIGHAIEALTGYKRFTHGEAVAIGMVAAAELSHSLGFLLEGDMEKQNSLLEKAGLPTRIPKSIKTEKIMEIMKKDKKAVEGRLKFILIKNIGGAIITEDVPVKLLKEVLNKVRG